MLPLAETTIMDEVYQEHPDYFHWAYEDLADELTAMFEHHELLAPTVSSRLAVFLASDECQVTGQAFSGMAGRYAAVMLGVTDGWLAPDVTAVRTEDIRDNFDVVNDRASFIEPASMPHEAIAVAKRHGYWTPPLDGPSVSAEPHEIIARVLASPQTASTPNQLPITLPKPAPSMPDRALAAERLIEEELHHDGVKTP